MKLLGLKEYCYPTLVGLVTSVGGLTESLVGACGFGEVGVWNDEVGNLHCKVRHSSQALLGHMKSVCTR